MVKYPKVVKSIIHAEVENNFFYSEYVLSKIKGSIDLIHELLIQSGLVSSKDDFEDIYHELTEIMEDGYRQRYLDKNNQLMIINNSRDLVLIIISKEENMTISLRKIVQKAFVDK